MKLLVKLMYMPFGIVFGMIGSRAGAQLFQAIWSRIDAGEPPTPKTRGANVGKIAAAAALQAGAFAATRAAANRAGANTFHYLVGAWPDEQSASESD